MIPREFYNDFLNRGLPVKDKNTEDITLELTGSFPTETVIVRTCQICIISFLYFSPYMCHRLCIGRIGCLLLLSISNLGYVLMSGMF